MVVLILLRDALIVLAILRDVRIAPIVPSDRLVVLAVRIYVLIVVVKLSDVLRDVPVCSRDVNRCFCRYVIYRGFVFGTHTGTPIFVVRFLDVSGVLIAFKYAGWIVMCA